MPAKIRRYIKNDPNIKDGAPVIAGTRVTVAEIISFLENEQTINSVILSLKKSGVIVTAEEVVAALEFAKYKSLNEKSSASSN